MPDLESRLEKSIDIISNRFYNVELQFMSIAGERLKSIYGLTNEQIRQYLYSGEFITDTRLDVKKVERSLSQAHRQNLNDMVGLFDDITAEVYSEGEELAEAKEATLSPKREYVSAANPLLAQAVRNYEVMARSTAVNDSYKKTIRQFVGRIASEGEDRLNAPMAMRQAIRELTAQGISSIDYKSGRSVRMDSAVRNSLMGEYTQIIQGIERKLGEEIGADGVEISAHQHSAQDHEPIQGRTFTNEEFEKLQNGETAQDIEGEIFQIDRPIGMWNCRHLYFPILIGISEPSFSSEELEAIKERNDEGIEFNGKKYTLYEAEQEQRKLETAMRHERENLNLLKEVRDTDPSIERAYQKNRERLAELRNEYKSLGAVLEPKAIRMKMERSYVPRGSTGNATLPQPDYKPVTPKTREEFQDRANQVFHAATETQQQALKGYTKTGFTDINGLLYGDERFRSAETENAIKRLDKMINGYILDRDIVSYRGTEARFYTNWETGGTYPLPAFVSTSLDKNNEIVNNDFFIELRIRNGTKGMYVGNLSWHKPEDEFLLGRGLQYKVIEKTKTSMIVEVSNG